MMIQLHGPAKPCGCCVPLRVRTARAKTTNAGSGFDSQNASRWRFLLDVASRKLQLHVLYDEELDLPNIFVELART